MKKIMILGGSRYIIPVIHAAKDMDLHVITCDYLPDNIAHKFSDEYCNVSVVDKNAVLKKARELGINGIMSFACDPGVAAAAYVAEKLGLPSCGSYESVSILQNKGRFRKFLKDNHFNVPWAYSYSEKGEALESADKFELPLIVKPVDSAGSKGAKKVTRKDELPEAIDNAIRNSHSGEFIVEQFLESDGHPSDSECFSVNGDLRFVTFSAQRFDKESANPYTPSGFTWNPSISISNQKALTQELQRLLNLLGMGTSLYNVETRQCKDGKAYLMEVSPRGGGNRLAEMLKFATGTDLIMCAIKAAMGETIDESFETGIKGNWAEVILHGRRPGRFKGIALSKEIEDYVIEKDIWIQPGDYVSAFTGANMTIGTLVLNFPDENLMSKIMGDPYRYIDIQTFA